ncbi:hypothetical protein C8R43DRAFT_964187 [Mycena crocata]|nr:hypothetical protein C8R43DRAFT_964187 [Mycena crocata]
MAIKANDVDTKLQQIPARLSKLSSPTSLEISHLLRQLYVDSGANVHVRTATNADNGVPTGFTNSGPPTTHFGGPTGPGVSTTSEHSSPSALAGLTRMLGRDYLYPIVFLVGLIEPQLFRSILLLINSMALSHRFTFSDTVPSIQYGVRTFMLTTAAAWGLFGGGTYIARAVHCAAHGIDLATRAAQFIPVHLPIAALREVGLLMPAISLLLSYPDNPFLRRRFPTRLAAIRAAERFQDWVNSNLNWMAECIFRSREKGLLSLWNFGAFLGMSKAEFVRRVRAALAPAHLNLTNDRGEPLPNQGMHRWGTFYYTALDLDVAHLIRPWYTHLGVIEGPTQIGAALYPVAHQLAGPMDVIMSSGFERMEQDYADTSARVCAAEEGVYDATVGF